MPVARVADVCSFLGLEGGTAEYFSTLVAYNRSQQETQSRILFEKLSSLRPSSARVLDADEYVFFQDWYNAAIYELILAHPFQGSLALLAQSLHPPIPESDAENSLALLQRIGLISKKPGGKWVAINQNLSTGGRWISAAIRAWQMRMIHMGADCIERIVKEDRDVSTVTISLSRSGFEALQERMRSIRQEFLELAKADFPKEKVYQFNFQIFPIATLPKDHQRPMEKRARKPKQPATPLNT